MPEKVNTNFHFPTLKHKLSISRRNGQYILELIMRKLLANNGHHRTFIITKCVFMLLAGHETRPETEAEKKNLFLAQGEK